MHKESSDLWFFSGTNWWKVWYCQHKTAVKYICVIFTCKHRYEVINFFSFKAVYEVNRPPSLFLITVEAGAPFPG